MYETWYTDEIDDEQVREIYAEEINSRGGFCFTVEHGVCVRDMHLPAIEED